MLEKFFKLKENNTNVKTEVIAGITTFMTMAYILAVNPNLLSASGMDPTAVLIATCLASFIGTLAMALLANYPFALAPGMGLNAYFAFTVCGTLGYSWQVALMAVFIEGLIFIVLSLTNVREAIFNAIPTTLKKGVGAGIGLFIAFIGLQGAHIVVDNGSTLVSYVNFRANWHTEGICAVLALIGLMLTAVLYIKKVKGAILIGILATWILGMLAQATGLYVVDVEAKFYSLYPTLSMTDFGKIGETFGQCFKADFSSVGIVNFIVVLLSFLFVDMFDTLGTLIGVSDKAGMLDKNGKLPRVKQALLADAVATSVGAVFGTSTTTTYVESSAGVGEAPQNKVEEAKAVLKKLISKYKITLISLGNGTASRESEQVIVELLKEIPVQVQYIIVNEAGASVYSASKLATEEFPNFDVGQRSAASMARRLQDPLAELVKIDPKSIGVGQYQHDMNQKKLSETLGGVVEDCVNKVGVDLNTASASLLEYISGISKTIAKNIVVYREENGEFTSRSQLLKVAKLGPKAYEQCAGFMRITGGKNPLDATGVHPESYEATNELLKKLGYTLEDVANRKVVGISKKISDYKKLAEELGVGELTLQDIVKELEKPARDPREDMPKPILRSDVLEIKDLTPGMTLKGTVRNVIDFGVFVDIGVHQDGLVHISEICDHFIKHPLEAVSVGDIVDVQVLSVDVKKERIQLTMKTGTNQVKKPQKDNERPKNPNRKPQGTNKKQGKKEQGLDLSKLKSFMH